MSGAVRWQYTISTDRTILNELGLGGWELVAAAVVDGVETFYFKKPLPGFREQITLEQREQVLAASMPGGEDA